MASRSRSSARPRRRCSRIYHNRHWASDVVMGAAIGTVVGNKVVRYHHERPGNRLDDWLLSGSASRDAAGKVVLRWSVLPVWF